MRPTLTVGRRVGGGAVDFFIGGDPNIELKLEKDDDEKQGFDSIEWYGLYGPECDGGGEDAIALQQLLQDFNCNVTSTWTNNEDNHVVSLVITSSQETARLYHGPKGYTLQDLVHEP